MKLEGLNNVAEVYGDVEQNTVGIMDKSMDKIIALLSTKLYSDPIGSFLREITSNAWDSHVEAGNDNPVLIKIGRDPVNESNIYILIRDYGTGLSPERFDEVYKYMGSTTKDDSDDYIGCFGLGKFSSLAVSEVVDITSYYQGTEYSYLMYKNGTGINIDLINTKETDELNGLSVVVKTSLHNYHEVIRSIRSQLKFFEGVYLEDLYKNNVDFNTRKNIEFNHFSLNEFTHRLEVQLGKCTYPLDFNLIANSNSIINKLKRTEIALKFDIGELDINPTRETLHYTDRTVKNIIAKVEKTIEELHNIKEEQLKDFDILNMPDPDTITIEGFFLVIPSYQKEVNIEGTKYKYDELYSILNRILTTTYFSPEYVLSNGAFKKYRYVTGDNLKRIVNSNLYNYNKDNYTNLQKKYIRFTYSGKSLLREDWGKYVDSFEFRRIWVKRFGTKTLSKHVFEKVKEKLKSTKEFEINITEEFKENNKPAPRRSVPIKLFTYRNFNTYDGLDEILTEYQGKTIVINDYTLGAIHEPCFESTNSILVKCNKAISKRLIKKGAITLQEWCEIHKDKIVEDYIKYKQAQEVPENIKMLNQHIKNIIRPKHKNLINYNSNNFSAFKNYLANSMIEVPEIDFSEYDEIINLSQAYRLDKELGVKLFVEKLVHLNYQF